MSRVFASLGRWLRTFLRAESRPGAAGVIKSALQTSLSDAGLVRFHLPIRLLVRVGPDDWKPLTFLIDTESEHTYIPYQVRHSLEIPCAKDRPCTIVTRTGRINDGGYFSPLTFAFEDLPGLEFTTVACFSRIRQGAEMPLLSMSDLLRHFSISVTAKPTLREQAGYLLLFLREDHHGQAR